MVTKRNFPSQEFLLNGIRQKSVQRSKHVKRARIVSMWMASWHFQKRVDYIVRMAPIGPTMEAHAYLASPAIYLIQT